MKQAYIGFDVGGTNIMAALVSKQGKILASANKPSQTKAGKKQIAKNVLDVIEELLKKDIKCLGICLTWPSKANMPLSLGEIKNIISKKYKLPLFYENDANLFTLTEAIWGQGKIDKVVVGVTLGTGIGCGVVENKKIFNGRGLASEFGHVSINFDGPKCKCGHRGCFEEYAGSRGLKRLAKKYKLLVYQGKDLYDLANKGNKQALGVWHDFGKYLGWGLYNIAMAYDPDVIVLGGQISKAHRFFGASMRKAFNKQPLFRLPKIKVSQLSNSAILAAALVDYKNKKRPR